MTPERLNSLLKNNNRDSLLRLTQKHQATGLSKLNKRELATIIVNAEKEANDKAVAEKYLNETLVDTDEPVISCETKLYYKIEDFLQSVVDRIKRLVGMF
jgi:hypothetical protein